MKQILFLILALIISQAQAQPTFNPGQRPIEIVIGYTAGGASDKWARTIDDIFVANGWKSTVVYKPGGDTSIASSYVAKSAPNGHTIYMAGNGFTDTIILKKIPNLEYSTSDFAPIVSLGNTTAVLVVGPDVPVSNYKEFKNFVKLNPTQFNLGFWNAGSTNLLNEWAKRENLPTPNIIPYKGSATQTIDLIGGRLAFTIDSLANVVEQQKAGKVKIIATLSADGEALTKRDDKSLSIFEIGKKYPDLDATIWFGLFCPAGTPPETIAKINQVLNQAFKSKLYDANLESLYVNNIGGTPNKLNTLQKNYIQVMEKANQK